MINTKLHNKALRKMRTLWCCCDCTDHHGMSWCSEHLRKFGEWSQVKRGTGKNSLKNNEAKIRKLIVHIPTYFRTLKLTLPHGLR